MTTTVGNSNNAVVAQSTYVPGAAVTGAVDEGTMTVEGRLEGLLDSDNPYIANARQRSAESSASRGMQNSSIAAGAGERAAIESSLPIAQQDAETYFTQQLENLGAQNDMVQLNTSEGAETNRFNTGETNRGILQDDEQDFIAGESDLDRSWESSENTADRDWKTGESELDRDWKTGESELDRDWESGESLLDRDWKTGEREADHDFKAGESELDRDWKTGESELDRDWKTGESEADRDFKAGESDKDRTHESSESFNDRTFEVAKINIKKAEDALDREVKTGGELLDALFQLSTNPNLTGEAKADIINNLIALAPSSSGAFDDIEFDFGLTDAEIATEEDEQAEAEAAEAGQFTFQMAGEGGR